MYLLAPPRLDEITGLRFEGCHVHISTFVSARHRLVEAIAHFDRCDIRLQRRRVDISTLVGPSTLA